MKYFCKCCKYETTINSNWNRHIKSKTHLDNIALVDDINDVILVTKTYNTKKFKCEYCENKFSRKDCLSRHMKICMNRCENKLEMGVAYEKLLDELTHFKKIIEEKDKKLEEKDKIILEQKDKQIEQLKEQLLESKEQLLESKKENKPKTIDALSFVQTYYDNAPPMVVIDDTALRSLFYKYENDKNKENKKQEIKETKEMKAKKLGDDEVINNIIHNFNHKKLHKYLGDAIYNFYGNTKSEDQSIWSSDVSRMSFLIRKENKSANKPIISKFIWERDPKGERVKEIAISPLITIVIKLMKKYIDKLAKEAQTEKITDYDKIDSRMKYMTTASNIRIYAEASMGDDILKYIAPKFALKRNKPIIFYSDESHSDSSYSDN